jgi:hypothetical protein
VTANLTKVTNSFLKFGIFYLSSNGISYVWLVYFIPSVADCRDHALPHGFGLTLPWLPQGQLHPPSHCMGIFLPPLHHPHYLCHFPGYRHVTEPTIRLRNGPVDSMARRLDEPYSASCRPAGVTMAPTGATMPSKSLAGKISSSSASSSLSVLLVSVVPGCAQRRHKLTFEIGSTTQTIICHTLIEQATQHIILHQASNYKNTQHTEHRAILIDVLLLESKASLLTQPHFKFQL